MTVTVSIEPQRWLVEQIAGDSVVVNTLLPDGANPENYDPPMSSLRNLEKSALYLTVGCLPFEDAVVDRLKSSTAGLTTVNTSEGIDLLTDTHGCSSDHHGEHHHGDGHHAHAVDPHVWSSVSGMRIMAANTLDALVAADPDNAAYYRDNHQRLSARLDSLDASLRRTLAADSGATFIVWHPSLSYFARDYGLNQMTLGEDNKELSANRLQGIIGNARRASAHVMFIQPEMDGGRSQTIAREIGADVVVINPLSRDWPGEMALTASSIAKKPATDEQ